MSKYKSLDLEFKVGDVVYVKSFFAPPNKNEDFDFYWESVVVDVLGEKIYAKGSSFPEPGLFVSLRTHVMTKGEFAAAMLSGAARLWDYDKEW
jgi:hypothetical protein